MPFGVWTRVDPRNHVLGGGPDHPKKGNLGEGASGDAASRQNSWTTYYHNEHLNHSRLAVEHLYLFYYLLVIIYFVLLRCIAIF